MVKRATQTPTVNFSRGLNTEQGELVFPEGASVDELNMDMKRDGSRMRRLGLTYEDDYEVYAAAHVEGDVVTTHLWPNAGGVSGLTFVVVQIGNTLHFYKEATGSVSGNKLSFTVNLSNYNRPEGFGASTVAVDVTSLQGILVVASPEINTIQVEYDDATNTIDVEELVFRVRDFSYVAAENGEDPNDYFSAVDEGNVTDARRYDTLNTGWYSEDGSLKGGAGALSQYVLNQGKYPPLTHPWYAGRSTVEDQPFRHTVFSNIGSLTSLTANGSHVLNLYTGDREIVSGISGLDTPETSRFKTVTSYAGRVFYSGMSNNNSDKIYFSQILYQTERLGDCFQRNDPTSEYLSDLLDTDGGFISINGAYNIQKLHVLGPYLIVFAENGVWRVSGVDDVFRATEYSVSKITDTGLQVKDSFVSAEGRPYWWSNFGIHTITTTDSGGLREVNISLDTVQTFWVNISAGKRSEVKSTYDRLNQKVYWFFPSVDESIEGKLTQVLIFDEVRKAFYPWSLTEEEATKYVLSPLFLYGNLTDEITFNVIDSSGNTIVDSNGDNVVVTRSARDYSTSGIVCLVRDDTGGITFTNFTDTEFNDWGTTPYSSYIVGGYNFAGDLSTRKIPIYMTLYFACTEESFEDDGMGGYTFVRPSSCLVSNFWDFSNTPASTAQQGYRLKYFPVPDGSSLSYPLTVTTSRLRLKGRGRSYRVRFESEANKDFQLLGFDAVIGLTGK